MKLTCLICLIFVLISCTAAAVKPNQKQNFCQKDKCLTCVGKYCTTTCRGKGCNDCPIGDCCDGTECNICRGKKCCETLECNTCIRNCLKTCEEKDSCHYDCFQSCMPNYKNQPKNGPGVKVFEEKRYLPVNVTTVINITNTIKNENFVISSPIIVNSTNINNYTTAVGNYSDDEGPVFEQKGPDPIRYHQIPDRFMKSGMERKHDCCEVVHPKVCHDVAGYNEAFCFIARHSECSTICTSRYVHIIETKNFTQKCVLIGVKPYFYCGKYETQDCDGCYDCGADFLECSRRKSCPKICKSTIVPESIYNVLFKTKYS